MKSKTILAGAAIAGLMSGSFAVQAHAANVTSQGRRFAQANERQARHKGCSLLQRTNSCKGKGGCKTGDNGCKGKNSCKGKGGCATDGSHPAESPPNVETNRRRATRARSDGESEFHPPLLLVISIHMPANPFNNFTDYGIGIGLRVPHYRHILEKKPVVDWFEIISENFMVDGGRPLEVLDQILEQYRVVQHGVAMYFGSADRLSREHLKKIKRLVKRTQYALAERSSLLGQRGRTLHARPAADALYVLLRPRRRPPTFARRAIFSRCRSASRM